MSKLGLIQMNSGAEVATNLAKLETQLFELNQRGAKLALTPENAVIFGK